MDWIWGREEERKEGVEWKDWGLIGGQWSKSHQSLPHSQSAHYTKSVHCFRTAKNFANSNMTTNFSRLVSVCVCSSTTINTVPKRPWSMLKGGRQLALGKRLQIGPFAVYAVVSSLKQWLTTVESGLNLFLCLLRLLLLLRIQLNLLHATKSKRTVTTIRLESSFDQILNKEPAGEQAMSLRLHFRIWSKSPTKFDPASPHFWPIRVCRLCGMALPPIDLDGEKGEENERRRNHTNWNVLFGHGWLLATVAPSLVVLVVAWVRRRSSWE